MKIHLRKEIDQLKKELLSLSSIVENNLEEAVSALIEREPEKARDVMSRDSKVDLKEVEIEEECLKVLALHQPVAIDLRLIVSIMKINDNLERIGDLATNIAERAAFLSTRSECEISMDFAKMSGKVISMLSRALDSLVKEDPKLAWEVCGDDDEVDNMNRNMYIAVQEGIKKHPHMMEEIIHMLSVSRHLERIGDLATNIAEDVIYMIEGRIVRHNPENY
ncbi:MAG: phosphate signaling complex protein PhoU [Candidatus Krumholzibacteriota bacterium]|nr:phosphate signaling complex protein PhoU [Candidatus Krumholzibacteriota bacterium]